MKKIRAAIVLLVACSLTISTGSIAYAAVTDPSGPGDVDKTQAELNGYSEEEWQQLCDNNLNYDELEDLIKNFNPNISAAWNSLDSSVDDLNTTVENLKSRQRDMRVLKEKAQETGDITGIIDFTMQEIILDKSSKAMNDAKKLLERPVTGTNRPIRQAQYQMTAGVQSVMIGYDSVIAQKEMLAKLVDMYQELYNVQTALASQQMATQTDIDSALVDLYSAKSNLASLESTEVSLKNSLITMCGWKESDSPVIGTIPASDISRIDSMNPDADITTAIGNNFDLITFRHTSYAKSLGATNAHNLTEEQMEANLKTNLDALYQTVLSDKQAYDAALAGYQSAEISKNAADTQLSLGMISKAQYLGANITYYQKKAAFEAADMTLLQSMETYDWAVKGICSVE